MNQSKISVRYAKALFLFAEEKKILDTVKDDVVLIAKAIKEIAEFSEFIINPIAKTSQKKLFFSLLLEKKICKETLDFLYMVIDNKRESYLEGMTRNFLDQYKKASGIKTVTLTGASEFSSEQKNKVISFVEKNFDTKVDLEEKIDSDIIGGFILRVEDQQFDASVANKLKEIKKDLLETNIQNYK